MRDQGSTFKIGLYGIAPLSPDLLLISLPAPIRQYISHPCSVRQRAYAGSCLTYITALPGTTIGVGAWVENPVFWEACLLVFSRTGQQLNQGTSKDG
jgi:hypothetical protein